MRHAGIILLTLAFLGGAAQAAEQRWDGDVNLLLAEKHLDEDEWGATAHQGELGLVTNWQGPSWPVAIAADFLASARDADIDDHGFTEQRGRTTELDLGVRKVWRPDSHIRPYIGGGLTVASASLERLGPAGDMSDSDSGAGVWAGGGVFWTVADALNIGLDARISHADVRLFGNDVNAGGFHLGLLLGYHWGG